jgi:PH (Pleckstrin Homology) domain-containing protein
VIERETLRLHPPVILWWVWVAFVLANVADYGAQGLPSARFGSVLAAILLLGTGLAYTLALRPKVIEDGDGLTVVNPFRVHHLPWPVIDSVDTGEWVRVRYAGRAVYCWALYVSTRARRKIAVGAAAGTAGVPRRLRGLVAAAPPGYAQPSSRLPDEALRLASLPVSAALAARLDSRAERERKRAEADATEAKTALTAWSWPAVAAVAVPALLLLAIALA